MIGSIRDLGRYAGALTWEEAPRNLRIALVVQASASGALAALFVPNCIALAAAAALWLVWADMRLGGRRADPSERIPLWGAWLSIAWVTLSALWLDDVGHFALRFAIAILLGSEQST